MNNLEDLYQLLENFKKKKILKCMCNTGYDQVLVYPTFLRRKYTDIGS